MPMAIRPRTSSMQAAASSTEFRRACDVVSLDLRGSEWDGSAALALPSHGHQGGDMRTLLAALLIGGVLCSPIPAVAEFACPRTKGYEVLGPPLPKSQNWYGSE